MPKPLASLSLDLDNQWSYMKTHGDPGWEATRRTSTRGAARLAIPRGARICKITLFVVGRMRPWPENAPRAGDRSPTPATRSATTRYHHEPWLHLYTEAEIERRVGPRRRTRSKRPPACGPTASAARASACRPTVLEVLARRGYRVRRSHVPHLPRPARPGLLLRHARSFRRGEAPSEASCSASSRTGSARCSPYRWQTAAGRCSRSRSRRCRWFKVPIHVSYLLYLAGFARLAERLLAPPCACAG